MARAYLGLLAGAAFGLVAAILEYSWGYPLTATLTVLGVVVLVVRSLRRPV